MTPAIQNESNLGLTDLAARSGGEGEVGAITFGTYCFTWIVKELTTLPLPASRKSANTVETDRPRKYFPIIFRKNICNY